MQIPGYRRSGRPIEAVLKRYIPVVTVLGGIIVGLVAASADFFGAFGTGHRHIAISGYYLPVL